MSDFWLGIIGVAVGSIVTGGMQWLLDYARYKRESKGKRELDTRRKVLLKQALDNPPPGKEWRELAALSRIIGADYETTTRLLIELEARGSETEKEVWALLSKKPLRH